jgi:hypothetical protein
MLLLSLLLLAPEQTYDLKLRFEKGMTYEVASTNQVKLKAIQGESIFKYDNQRDYVLRRTVTEVGPDGLPAAETVEVRKGVLEVREKPDDKIGVTESAAQGKTFTWRRKKDGEWVLHDGDEDVTKTHEDVVQRLRSRSSLRLPPAPVTVGGTWEVPARTFQESEGLEEPEGLAGKATFKLEEVKDGIARVTFELELSHLDHGQTITNRGKGVWLIDVSRGRELKLEAEGKIEIADARGGFGTVKTSREITYP